MAAKGGGLVRTVLQQCLQARLQVQEADEQQAAQYVQEEFMCLGILFTNEGKMESYIDRRIGAVSAVKQVLYQSVMEKKELDLQINRGMVIYICFFKGATDDILPKMVNTLLNLRLCELPSGKRVSVLELPGSLLIVPQATLGGKAKGKGMQYHNNISKEDGVKLYSSFISLCEKELMAAGREAEVTVRHGTYGQRQVLQLDTNGPYTHLMDF